ncbi:MAG: YidC/Oxa1 family membrane protein insertase [Patescibacteria group bacterium]
MKDLLITLFYEPLYNGLVFLLGTLPIADVGLAVILFTILIKLVLMPLSKKSLETQINLKKVEPEINDIRKKYKDDAQTQGVKIMEVYKLNKINPFSGFFLILIQLPIIFSLYYIFLRAGLPSINEDLLYSFISIPVNIDMHLLGRFNLAEKSVVLALLAGISQFIQARLSLPPDKPKDKNKEFSMKDEFAKSLSMQMKYVMPVVIVFIAYSLSAVVALYWTTSNIFAIGQEYWIKKRIYAKNEASDNKK